MAEDGFLARWSRRKAQVDAGEPVPAVAPREVPVAQPEAVPAPRPSAAAADPVAAPVAAAEPAPLTLADVERLSAQSNFAPFAARSVDPAVRNAALKKLFHSDPHFNVMDGLDTYIDDYGKADPLPRALMRQLMQARTLGLLDDELEEQDPPPGAAAAAAAAGTADTADTTDAGPNADTADPAAPVAAAPAAGTTPHELPGPAAAPLCDEDADLQLQRHDGAGRTGVGARAERVAEPGRICADDTRPC